MTDDAQSQPSYDPSDPVAPQREPPVRTTAPQTPFSRKQVLVGFVFLFVGLALTFGLPLVIS